MAHGSHQYIHIHIFISSRGYPMLFFTPWLWTLRFLSLMFLVKLSVFVWTIVGKRQTDLSRWLCAAILLVFYGLRYSARHSLNSPPLVWTTFSTHFGVSRTGGKSVGRSGPNNYCVCPFKLSKPLLEEVPVMPLSWHAGIGRMLPRSVAPPLHGKLILWFCQGESGGH